MSSYDSATSDSSVEQESKDQAIATMLRASVLRLHMLSQIETQEDGYSFVRVLKESLIVQAIAVTVKAIAFCLLSPLVAAALILAAPLSYKALSMYEVSLHFPFFSRRTRSSHNIVKHVVYAALSLVPAGASLNIILFLATDVSVSKSETVAPALMYLAFAVAAGLTNSLILAYIQEEAERLSRRLKEAEEASVLSDSDESLRLMSSSSDDDDIDSDIVGQAEKDLFLESIDPATRASRINAVVADILDYVNSDSIVLTGRRPYIAMAALSFVLAVGHTLIGPIFRHVQDDGRGWYGNDPGTNPKVQDYIVWWTWAYCSTFVGTFFLACAQMCALSLWDQVSVMGAVHSIARSSDKDTEGTKLVIPSLDYSDSDTGPATPFVLDLTKRHNHDVWIMLRTKSRSQFMSSFLLEILLPSTTLIALVTAVLMTLTMLWRLVLRTRSLDELAVFCLVDAVAMFMFLIALVGAGIEITDFGAKERDLFRDVLLRLRTMTTVNVNSLRIMSDKLQSQPKSKKSKSLRREMETLELSISDLDIVASSLKALSDANAVAPPYSVLGLPLTTSLRNKLASLAISGIASGLARVLGWA